LPTEPAQGEEHGHGPHWERDGETGMTNDVKEKIIRSWVNPEKRITVDFLDAADLNARVTKCTRQLVLLSIETHVPHLSQHILAPLSQVEVLEDLSHYTQDPERHLQRKRLMLIINEKRPPIMY
jgi:hypothetical protein